jgi:LEM3 (ligand-effect modulator 3) family / CDC50 family
MRKKNQPDGGNFNQQNLEGFQPLLTPGSLALTFFTAALVLYALGVPIYLESENVQEYSVDYEDCKSHICSIHIQVTKNIPGPVFFYYKLTDFYQNHRLYLRSKSYAQLRNGSPIQTELNYCSPAKYNSDFVGYYNSSKDLNPGEIARPCGMIARSVFNDSFNAIGYTFNFDKIVFSNDKNVYVDHDPETEWRSIDNHLIVWMKPAIFADFRKLWGVIDQDIPAGSLEVQVTNNYNVSSWKGTKGIVISNSSVFGGKNPLLGIVFIAVGSFCVMAALIFSLTGIVFKEENYHQDLKKLRF